MKVGNCLSNCNSNNAEILWFVVFQTIANMTFLEKLIPEFPVLPNLRSFIIPQLNSPNITGYQDTNTWSSNTSSYLNNSKHESYFLDFLWIIHIFHIFSSYEQNLSLFPDAKLPYTQHHYRWSRGTHGFPSQAKKHSQQKRPGWWHPKSIRKESCWLGCFQK